VPPRPSPSPTSPDISVCRGAPAYRIADYGAPTGPLVEESYYLAFAGLARYVLADC
jgi:hypothetical protein